MLGSHEQKCQEPIAVYSVISKARGPGTKDQTEVESRWRGCAVYSIISNAIGPRTRLKWRVGGEGVQCVCVCYHVYFDRIVCLQ
jgi:hypothetical protein